MRKMPTGTPEKPVKPTPDSGVALYPLKFVPAMKSYLWGGRGLERLGKKLPDGIVAESWEISGHPDGLGTVADGPLAGSTLPELMERYGRSLVGTALPPTALAAFPLLVKLIDANDRLSVQVHPDDAYAAAHENGSLGKTEMWVVLDAQPGAKLVFGLRPGITKDRFTQAVREGKIADCLNEVPARKGDVFDIPAGLVHAIGEGLIIAEIQQSSNTTYRVYDYDRTDTAGNKRPLHVDKALDVIRFGDGALPAPLMLTNSNGQGAEQTLLVLNRYFAVERIVSKGRFQSQADGKRFELLMIIDGSAVLSWQGGTMPAATGESFLIPASLGTYTV